MRLLFISYGKTADPHLSALLSLYAARLAHYVPFEAVELPSLRGTRSLTEERQKALELEQLRPRLREGDRVILLDEKGTQRRSTDFARWLSRELADGSRARLVFVAGGPYGFAPEAYRLASGTLSLSLMTFSHQMIRLLFTEQLYRAFTIMRGEPYHHE